MMSRFDIASSVGGPPGILTPILAVELRGGWIGSGAWQGGDDSNRPVGEGGYVAWVYRWLGSGSGS